MTITFDRKLFFTKIIFKFFANFPVRVKYFYRNYHVLFSLEIISAIQYLPFFE